MLSPEEALKIILDGAPVLGEETVGFLESPGRVLARDIASPEDMPPFDRSAMDGYAVRAADVASASPERPATLRLAGLAKAGRPAGVRLGPGEAVKIMTGGVVPEGADAVVMQEDTDEDAGRVRVFQPCRPGEHICRRSEDIRRGEKLLQKGTLLPPAAAGLFASLGLSRVSVVRRPRVAILSTGDELVDVDETPGPGQIRNANQYTLHALVEQAGGVPALLGAAPDRREELMEKMREAQPFDALISTGGVSVGEFDLVGDILAEAGVEILFDRVAVKPGRPMVFGRRGQQLVFGLPGNPTSTVVSFLLFVRPALRKMGGRRDLFLERRQARLAETYRHRPGRKEFVRVVLEPGEAGPVVRPAGHQGSGNLLGAVAADGLMEVESDAERLEAGSEVTVHLFPHMQGGSRAG